MKLIALVGAAALALAGGPAQADTVLPNTLAMRYCSLRQVGASQDDALRSATRDAMVPGDQWIWVTLHGQRVQSDIAESVLTIQRQCPEYLPK